MSLFFYRSQAALNSVVPVWEDRNYMGLPCLRGLRQSEFQTSAVSSALETSKKIEISLVASLDIYYAQ